MRINAKRFLRILAVGLLCFGVSGCAGMRSHRGLDVEGPSYSLEQLRRPVSPNASVQELSISKAELTRRLTASDAQNSVRVVEVYRRGSSMPNALPEYRLFDVSAHSAYALLGLQTADVLVAAEELAFSSPGKFAGYVSLLQTEPKGLLEVRRDGQPIVFHYTMTP